MGRTMFVAVLLIVSLSTVGLGEPTAATPTYGERIEKLAVELIHLTGAMNAAALIAYRTHPDYETGEKVRVLHDEGRALTNRARLLCEENPERESAYVAYQGALIQQAALVMLIADLEWRMSGRQTWTALSKAAREVLIPTWEGLGLILQMEGSTGWPSEWPTGEVLPSAWSKVGSWTGRGHKSTERFTVGSPWKVTWLTRPGVDGSSNFAIWVHHSDGSSDLAANVIGLDHDESIYHEAGTYHLGISAGQPYTVTVYQR